MKNREKFITVLWFTVATAYVIGYQHQAFGGYEWFNFRRAILNDGIAAKVANPPYVFALLYPLGFFPVRVGVFVFSMLSIGAIYLTHRLTRVNKWLLLLSYPGLRNLFYNQLDTFSMLGVALGWWAIERKRPVWLGVALVLLGIKPQATGGLGVVYLAWGWHLSALLIPSIVLLHSLVVYGFWFPDWTAHVLSQSTGADAFFQGGLGAYPWGLLAWIPLFIGYRFYSRKDAAAAIIAATMLSTPYVGTYSVMAFLGLPFSWLTVVFALPLGFWFDLRIVLVIVILYPWLKHLWQSVRQRELIP